MVKSMDSVLLRSIILAVVRIFIMVPWAIAGAAAFYKKRRVARRTVILSIAAITVFIVASNIFLYTFMHGDNYYLLDQVAQMATNIFVVFFFALCYRLYASQLVYVFCLLYAVSTLVNQLSYIIVSVCSPPGAKIAIITSGFYRTLMIALTLIFAFFLYHFCRKQLNEAFDTLEPKSIWQFCLVPIVFLVTFEVSHTLLVKFNGDPAFLILLILLFTAAILTHVVNLQAIVRSVKTARMHTEAVEAKKLLSVQEHSYAQLLENIQQTQEARHDLRFHLSVISQFAQKGDIDALNAYLAEYSSRISVDELKLCDNAAVDALVRHFSGQAKALGAQSDCIISLPAKPSIAEADLCVVLGNLLENAVHSLEKQGEGGILRMRCAEQGKRVLITMDNSLPKGFKGYKKGIGLQSVGTVAAMYNGSAKFETADEMFKASIILHISET